MIDEFVPTREYTDEEVAEMIYGQQTRRGRKRALPINSEATFNEGDHENDEDDEFYD